MTTEMVNLPGRLLRGSVAILNMIILDQAIMEGPWAIANAIIATYLMFTAVTGECIVKEYLFRRVTPTGKDKQARYQGNS